MCTVGAQKRRAISVIHFSSIEKGYEVYRRYICVVNSSEMNGILLFHEFIRDLIVVLLSQVTTSLCRAPLKIARLLYSNFPLEKCCNSRWFLAQQVIF